MGVAGIPTVSVTVTVGKMKGASSTRYVTTTASMLEVGTVDLNHGTTPNKAGKTLNAHIVLTVVAMHYQSEWNGESRIGGVDELVAVED